MAKSRRVMSASNPHSLHPQSVWRVLSSAAAETRIRASRTVYHPGDTYPLHTHDYAECCWVVHGSIVLTESNHEDVLETGAVRLIHPAYRHGFRVPRTAPCELVNIAVPWITIEAMATRYAGWLWGDANQPIRRQLDRVSLFALDHWPETIGLEPCSAIVCDGCLLAIQAACRHQAPHADPALPSWLRDALDTFDHPPHLAGGISALVALTGRSREHCSRVVRERTGTTLSDLVNQRRLAAFEQSLQHSTRAIGDLAAEVWAGAPAQLYRLFKQRHGCTPSQWRRQASD